MKVNSCKYEDRFLPFQKGKRVAKILPKVTNIAHIYSLQQNNNNLGNLRQFSPWSSMKLDSDCTYLNDYISTYVVNHGYYVRKV